MISLKTKDWELKDIETILFDKDGTFIDLHFFWGKMTEFRVKEIIKKYHMKNEFFNKLCLCLGYDIKSGKMLHNGITALYSRSKIIEIFAQDLKKFDVFVSKKELEEIFDLVSSNFHEKLPQYTKPINEAINFIKSVRMHNIKLGIVTSDSKESTLLTLKHFGWEALFDVVIGRESSPHTKESGEPTKLALNAINANPKTTIMIGDAPMDYISAQNAGIKNSILTATGQIEEEELKQTSPYTVKSLNEIIIIP